MYLVPNGFTTERLYTEQHDASNQSEWLEFFMHPENLKHLGLEFELGPEKLCMEWSERQQARYKEGHGAVLFRSRRDHGVVGNAGILLKDIEGMRLVEIGYSILKKHQGKGYASEIAQALRDHAFGTTDVDVLYSTISPDNIGSQKVAMNNGMTRGRQAMTQGVVIDLWSIRREKWESEIRPNSLR